MRTRVLLSLAALAVLGACDKEPSGPPAPVPGTLTVSLTAPGSAARAVMVTVSGPEAITAVESANPAYVVHSRGSGTTFRAAVFGTLSSGALLRFSVPDVGKAASYAVAVMEVADAENRIVEGSTGYSAAVSK